MTKIDDIIEVVSELDIESTDVYRACVCLLVADTIKKTDPKSLSDFTGVSLKLTKKFCNNWYNNGIFGKNEVYRSSGWFDYDDDLGLAFVLDACVATGLTKRIRTEYSNGSK